MSARELPLPDTAVLTPVLQHSARMPVVFVGHGSPLNAIERNAWHLTWEDMGQQLLARCGRPQLVLCISAHWITGASWWLTGMAQPRTIHDFGGFPRELFEQQYPAPGAPEAVQALARFLRDPDSGAPLGVDAEQWGLDHGAWGVLKPMFPKADLPVAQLSIAYDRPPAQHFALGRQLAALRERGVLIVASGNIVHNLRALRAQAGINATYTWAQEFDSRVTHALQAQDWQSLIDFQSWGEIAELAHPSYDHYLPLLYAIGAAGPDEAPQFFNTGFQRGAISMRSVLWG